MIAANTLNEFQNVLCKSKEAFVIRHRVEAEEFGKYHFSQAISSLVLGKCFKDCFLAVVAAVIADVCEDCISQHFILLRCGEPSTLGDLQQDEAVEGVYDHVVQLNSGFHVHVHVDGLVIDPMDRVSRK